MTTMTDALIAELTQEAATTRRVLERVPEDRLGWSPHPKSMSLGQLALHIASVPGGVADLLNRPTGAVPSVPLPEAGSVDELLTALDDSIAHARSLLLSWGDEGLMKEWSLTRGAETILRMPRIAMARAIMLNHWYHHRGQLVVYLRLLDVPVPAVYGSSADEGAFD